MSVDQRNNNITTSNNNNNGDEDDATIDNIARRQKYMMMMGQDESIGASNPYRVAYQEEYGTNLLDQYKFMEDEIAVREH